MKVTLAKKPQATIELRYVGLNARDTFAATTVQAVFAGSFEPAKSEDDDSIRIRFEQADAALSFERADKPGQKVSVDFNADLMTVFGDCWQYEFGAGKRGFTVEVAEVTSAGRKVLLSETCEEGAPDPDFKQYTLADGKHWGARFFIFFAMTGTPSAQASVPSSGAAPAKKAAKKSAKKAKKGGG
jgi:hypothetical protein